ncbi:CBS domain-containing protein [Streptomyces sp. NPDC047117]|uniref:CBS domain-containing protein n=1 Tax=unclassified Streptomyces TaxID=2593676 RepID=UPI00340867B7
MHHRPISDVMSRDVVAVQRNTPFKQVAALLAQHGISGVPVIDGDDKVLGVVSEADLMARQAAAHDEAKPRRFGRLHLGGRRMVRAESRAVTAGDLMTKPAITVGPLQSLTEAAGLMARHHCNRLPVIDVEGRLMGIVTRGDLVSVFLRPDNDIRTEIIEEVLVRTLWLKPHTVEVTVHNGVVTLAGTLQRSSEIPLAVRFASRVDGVVDVIDRLDYQEDDSHLRPSEQALHGIAEEWLRRI